MRLFGAQEKTLTGELQRATEAQDCTTRQEEDAPNVTEIFGTYTIK